MQTLKERLQNWTDFDIAQYHLGIVLGIFINDANWLDRCMGKDKHFMWTNNPLGNTLSTMLHDLVKIGILEINDEPQFRWNPKWSN